MPGRSAFAALALACVISGCTTVPAATESAGTVAQTRARQVEQRRPNIIFIMSDDHAQTAISAYGSEIGRLAPPIS